MCNSCKRKLLFTCAKASNFLTVKHYDNIVKYFLKRTPG